MTINFNYEEKLVQIFNHFKDQNISIPNHMSLNELAFHLPGSPAFVKQVFFKMNNTWSVVKKNQLEDSCQSFVSLQNEYQHITSSKVFDEIKITHLLKDHVPEKRICLKQKVRIKIDLFKN